MSGNRAKTKSFAECLVELSEEIEPMSQIAVDTIRDICERFDTESASYMDAKRQFRARIGRNPSPEEKEEISTGIKRVAFSRTDELIDHLCFSHTDYMGVKQEFRRIKGRALEDREKSNVQSKLRAIEWAQLVQAKEALEAETGETKEDDHVDLTSGELASVRQATLNLRAEIDRAMAQVTGSNNSDNNNSNNPFAEEGLPDDDSLSESEDTDDGDPESDDDFSMLEHAAVVEAAQAVESSLSGGASLPRAAIAEYDGEEEEAEAVDPMEEARRMMAEALLDPAEGNGQVQDNTESQPSDDGTEAVPAFDAEAHRARLLAARKEAEEREREAAEAAKIAEEKERQREAQRMEHERAAEKRRLAQQAELEREAEERRQREAAREEERQRARQAAARKAEEERLRIEEEQRRKAEAEAARIAAIANEQERLAAEEAERARQAKAQEEAEKMRLAEEARRKREEEAAEMERAEAAAETARLEAAAKAKAAELEKARAQAEEDTTGGKSSLLRRPTRKKSMLVIQMTQKIKQASMYTPPKRDLKRHGKSDKIRLLARCFMSKNETESDILRRMKAPAMRDRAARKKAFSKLEGKLSQDQGSFVQDALKNIVVQAVVAIPDSAPAQEAAVTGAVDATKTVVVARNSVTESTLKNLKVMQVQREDPKVKRKKSGKLDLNGVVADIESSKKTAAELAHLPKLHQLQRQEALARRDRLNGVTKGLGDFCLETEKLAAAAMVSAGYLGNTANMEPIGACAIAGFMGKKHRNGAWGKRCFVVKADTRELHYFKTDGKGAKRSIGDWIGCAQLDAIKLMKKKGRVLQIVFHDFYAKEHKRDVLTLRAKTEEIVEEWIAILQATMQAGSAVNSLAEKFASQTSQIANSISDRMASSIDSYASKMLAQGHQFLNVDELISHQFSRALKILKSIMDTTQGKAVLELEAIRLKETTDITQDDMQFAYDNLLDMLERAVVLHCHNWWVTHMGAEPLEGSLGPGALELEEDDDEAVPSPPPRGVTSP